MSSIPARMKKIQLKMKALECSQDFSHYKSMGIFPDAQEQLTPQSLVQSGRISKMLWMSSLSASMNSQGYCRFRIFSKYEEIGYFGRLKLFPFQGLTRVHFSLFSENNGFLNIYMLK